MSEQAPPRPKGPAMVVATSVMKKPPLRVAKITDQLVLPRSVQLRTLAAAVGGALVGLAVGAVFRNFTSMLYGAAIFAAAAVFLLNYSPLQGESTAKWLTLLWSGRKGRTADVDGEKVRVSIGICPVVRPAAEAKVHIWPGSVRVPPSQYDDRGVRISAKNRNLDAGDAVPANRWAGPDAAPAGRPTFPPRPFPPVSAPAATSSPRPPRGWDEAAGPGRP